MVMTVQHYECASYHLTVRLKMVNTLCCVFYHEKKIQYSKSFPTQLEKMKSSPYSSSKKDKITYRRGGLGWVLRNL